MKFDIIPYGGAGCVNFGMNREDIRKCFNNQYKEFKKTPLSESLTDDLRCCHIYYKENDICEAVEFFEGAEVIFDGKLLLGIPYNKIKDMFEAIDDSLDFNDAGFTSYKYGIGVFTSYASDEPDEPVEAVIIFEKGYYD